MRLFQTFFLAGAVVYALRPPEPDLIPRLSLTPTKGLTLIQSHHSNLTLPTLSDSGPIICYNGLSSRSITRESCTPLINYFANSRDFRLPKLWIPGPREPEWQLQRCGLRILSGKWDSRFSMQDVVVEMERVLAMCQPPSYLGVGGSAPVDGKAGLMYAAFHVQVTGV